MRKSQHFEGDIQKSLFFLFIASQFLNVCRFTFVCLFVNFSFLFLALIDAIYLLINVFILVTQRSTNVGESSSSVAVLRRLLRRPSDPPPPPDDVPAAWVVVVVVAPVVD